MSAWNCIKKVLAVPPHQPLKQGYRYLFHSPFHLIHPLPGKQLIQE